MNSLSKTEQTATTVYKCNIRHLHYQVFIHQSAFGFRGLPRRSPDPPSYDPATRLHRMPGIVVGIPICSFGTELFARDNAAKGPDVWHAQDQIHAIEGTDKRIFPDEFAKDDPDNHGWFSVAGSSTGYSMRLNIMNGSGTLMISESNDLVVTHCLMSSQTTAVSTS
ncbi:hypothetical protein EV401DRAFT_2200168 [Pisolithus croceorrhizus]|nr:hypothetical protein EV401DRAFT_2200168 [Pisolithus croceorrhizus]